ncbi:MAG: 30S ribosomal protein S16 [Buchnera aphidicola (Chaetogeoica yunlongensis)]
MVKIRLARLGSKKKPFYKIIITDSRCPRNGKFIEQVGFFKPTPNLDTLKNISINTSRLKYWENNGAIMSPRVIKLTKTYFKIINNTTTNK